MNALCWTRTLDGDFEAIAAAAGPLDEINTLDEEALRSPDLGPAGQRARRWLVDDLRPLGQAGLEPSPDLIPAYPRDSDNGPVPVDMYDFHADSANALADAFPCSHTVASSEGVPQRRGRAPRGPSRNARPPAADQLSRLRRPIGFRPFTGGRRARREGSGDDGLPVLRSLRPPV